MLGLNETSDGDVGLSPGEASVMRNWRVTADGHLSLRPGTELIAELAASPVRGIWHGSVGGSEKLLAAAGGHIWDVSGDVPDDVGTVTDSAHTTFFGFAGRVFVLTGSEYMSWDGTGSFDDVEGYAPLITVATPPSGGGTPAEGLNALTGARRQLFSPDGYEDVFVLAEKDIDEVLWVRLNGSTVTPHFVDLVQGTVQLSPPPAEGVNTVEICWRKGNGDRSAVESMHFCETFNGVSDTRIFLYGNGTNRAVYSGINEHGEADPTYFPVMSFVDIDSSNTPITGMVRHFDRLLAFKTDGMWALEYGTLTLSDGSIVPGFPVIPVNREIGCGVPGFVRLVDNCPVTLHARGLYRWALSGAAVRDERTAERISARAEKTLAAIDPAEISTADDERTGEFYILSPGLTLVWNYARNAFYAYSGIPVTCAAASDGTLWLGTSDGKLLRAGEELRSDSGTAIDAVWESGSLAPGREWQRKYSTRLMAVLKPQDGARARLSARTDRGPCGDGKLISAGMATFAHMSFGHLSFNVNGMPHTRVVRLRMSRYVYCRLILTSCDASAAPTVLELAVEFNLAGKVK